ncbi:MAG TPA: hypothetical protein VK953_00350 [Methylophilus sp.]|nr:hypothetical protein [Methylophilus sp.]
MFNLNSAQIQDICNLTIISDREIRSDLSIAMIVDENDYTSNFTGALRRNINSYSRTGIKAKSFTLPKKIEEAVGCDATIIIQSNGYSKVIMFEAKWPRISDPHYRWDYSQTSTGLSHFSDQLDRQSSYYSLFAIFEMVYCEYPFGKQPAYMQSDVSSCIWHEDAVKFKNSRAKPDSVWSQKDMIEMLKTGNNTIAEIIKDVCTCKRGQPIEIRDAQGLIREFRIAGEVLVIEFDEYKNEF